MIQNEYPFNLIRAIYGDSQKNNDHTHTTYLKGLYEQIRLLDDKEQKCLSMRYKDQLTLKACGEYYGITAQSIRPIVNRALRKLRHRSRSLCYEAVPRVEMKRLENRCQKVNEENQQLNEALHALNSASIDPDVVILLANMLKSHHLTAHIGELKLSTRAYNALSRAGLFTVKDIIAIPESELHLMRNLGEKTVWEIKAKIKAYILLPETYPQEQEEAI
jgi:predicted DNA-binding protein YlxM (UPF0122 family)